jgi:hypothetical protein
MGVSSDEVRTKPKERTILLSLLKSFKLKFLATLYNLSACRYFIHLSIIFKSKCPLMPIFNFLF